MADTIKPAHHGWDHSVGGEDPLTNIPQGPSGQGFTSAVYLPVLELKFQSNNLEASATPTWAIDSTYAFNGYMQMNAQNAYVAWPVMLAPKGSTWMPYAILAQGSDFGQVRIRIGSAPAVSDSEDADGLGGAGLFKDYSAVSFVSFPAGGTFDCYAASPTPYGGSSQIWPGFRVEGDDGVAGTGFTATTAYAGYAWDGGAGPHFVELSVPTKNASSTGYRMRISAFGFLRTDWDGLF